MHEHTSSFGGRERAVIALLALVAILRVWVFAAAFPFFTNVDEHRHVDMVIKYARGYLPLPGQDAYEARTAALLAVHGSPEYGLAPEVEYVPLPTSLAPDGEVARRMRFNERFLSRGPNLEAFQPPVYYVLAGAWFATGEALGLPSLLALYWIRALNGVGLALLVVVAWRLLRRTHPDEPWIRLGVPALLAFFPQDSLYYVTPDALSPLMGGLAFALAARVAMRGPRGVSLCAAAGAAAALAFLTKYTNAFALVLCALAFAALLWRERGQGVRQLAPPLIGGAVLVLPTAAWLIRNQLRFGSLTATAHKVELLGWQPKPLLSWWDHPLFTPSGLAAFVTDLVPMFWRGEIVWRRQALALPAADAFFVLTSAVAVALAVWWTWRHRKRTGLVEAGALLALFVAVSTLGILSLAFEFHARSNPPDHHPYFVQGRLISGAMLPFALLYVRGIAAATERATPGVARVLRASLLAVVALVVVGSEIALTRPVFASAYNLYQVGAE